MSCQEEEKKVFEILEKLWVKECQKKNPLESIGTENHRFKIVVFRCNFSCYKSKFKSFRCQRF